MTPKILLVDDVVMFLELQRTFLKRSSVRILIAKNGAEALQIARKECPDLIFLDLHMPNMSGAECCARIKADPLLRSVPVVMITYEGREDDKAVCQKAGCDGFITKPIDRIIFLETARKFVPSIDRREPRIPSRAKVKFRVYGVTLSGELIDICSRGVYVATDYEVDTEMTLELSFTLEDDAGALIQAKGRIAWVNSKKNTRKREFPAGFGVEFIAMTDVSRLTLDHFMEKHKRE